MSVGADLGPAGQEARRRLLDLMGRGPGKLAGERELAAEVGVSRSTLRQALAALEAEGLVRRVPGRGGGTFVAAPKVDRDLSRIVGVPALLRDQGFTAGTRVLRAAVGEPDRETAQALGLDAGAPVLAVVRIRLADGAPISLEDARFPAHRFPDLLEQSLGGSLYDLLRDRYGVTPAEAEERIEVQQATADEAAILGVQPGAALLSIRRRALDGDGAPIEYSHDLFRADRTQLTIRSRGGAPADAARGRGTVVQLRPSTGA